MYLKLIKQIIFMENVLLSKQNLEEVFEKCPGYPFCMEYAKKKENIKNNKIILKGKNSNEIITCGNLMYCIADKQYTWLYFTNNKKIIISTNIGTFSNDLPICFFRISHNCILNLHFISAYSKARICYITLLNGTKLKTSYRKKSKFMKILKQINNKE